MALIPEEPKKRNALLVGVFIVVGGYFFNSMWFSVKKIEITEMEARLESLDAQNRQANIVAARGGRDLEERLAVYERHILKLEQLIPAQDEVSTLVNDLTAEALERRVEVASIRPEPEETGQFYTLRGYEISALGEFHDIGRFITAIASQSRIITPLNLDISPFEGNQSDLGGEGVIEARFRIETYVLPDPVEQLPAPPPAGGGP